MTVFSLPGKGFGSPLYSSKRILSATGPCADEQSRLLQRSAYQFGCFNQCMPTVSWKEQAIIMISMNYYPGTRHCHTFSAGRRKVHFEPKLHRTSFQETSFRLRYGVNENRQSQIVTMIRAFPFWGSMPTQNSSLMPVKESFVYEGCLADEWTPTGRCMHRSDIDQARHTGR